MPLFVLHVGKCRQRDLNQGGRNRTPVLLQGLIPVIAAGTGILGEKTLKSLSKDTLHLGGGVLVKENSYQVIFTFVS